MPPHNPHAPHNRSHALVCVAGIATSICMLVTGCSKSSNPQAADTTTTTPPAAHAADKQQEASSDTPVQTYTVRGEIVGLPAKDRPFDELQIHHEAIPNFADRNGKVMENSKGMKGMMAMTMPYPVAKGVSLDGYKIGDKIEFTFQVTWGEDYPTYAITKITKLPPDTTLNFGN